MSDNGDTGGFNTPQGTLGPTPTAAPTADGPTLQDPQESAIAFNVTSFGDRTFVATEISEVTLTWRVSPRLPELKIDNATWFRDNVTDGVIAVGYPPGQEKAVPNDGRRLAMSDGAVTLPFQYVTQENTFPNELYLILFWSVRDQPGWTQSGQFSVAVTEQNELAPPFEPSEEPASAVALLAGPTTVAVSTAIQTPTSTGTSSDSTTTAVNAPPGGGASTSKSGLGTGAIAGIAVGSAAFAILLIGALLWFFVFRRRSHKSDHVNDAPYASDGHGPHDYMVEKETHPRVTESPQSPYSDDGHLRDDAMLAHTLPPPAHSQAQTHAHDPAYSPYTDAPAIASPQPHPPQEARSGARSATGTRSATGARSATPQGVNPSVAHLVEDGMTADEIRRLEEEERALDAAIEQRGSRR